MDVFSCSGVVVAMPEIALAGGFRIYVVCTVMDSQVQGICAGAVIGIGVIVGVFPRRIILKTMPKVALTGSFGISSMRAVEDDEHQGVNTRCALVVGVGVGIPS